jgi:hypothetical protein
MGTRQICCLRDVGAFPSVFPSDLLPKYPVALSGTLIVNTDPHTESGSHRFAIHFQSRSSTAYYFDSYGLPPFIPSIQTHQTQLHRLGLQVGTATMTYYSGLRQILLSLRIVHE